MVMMFLTLIINMIFISAFVVKTATVRKNTV